MNLSEQTSNKEELERLRSFAEQVVKAGHWEAGCTCSKCFMARDAERALGREPRVRQHFWMFPEGKDL